MRSDSHLWPLPTVLQLPPASVKYFLTQMCVVTVSLRDVAIQHTCKRTAYKIGDYVPRSIYHGILHLSSVKGKGGDNVLIRLLHDSLRSGKGFLIASLLEMTAGSPCHLEESPIGDDERSLCLANVFLRSPHVSLRSGKGFLAASLLEMTAGLQCHLERSERSLCFTDLSHRSYLLAKMGLSGMLGSTLAKFHFVHDIQ